MQAKVELMVDGRFLVAIQGQHAAGKFSLDDAELAGLARHIAEAQRQKAAIATEARKAQRRK